MYAWDASDGARLDAAAYALPELRPHLLGVVARILVGLVLGVRAPGGFPSALQAVLLPDVPARNKPGARRFAA
jgi:hypothetical protein